MLNRSKNVACFVRATCQESGGTQKKSLDVANNAQPIVSLVHGATRLALDRCSTLWQPWRQVKRHKTKKNRFVFFGSTNQRTESPIAYDFSDETAFLVSSRGLPTSESTEAKKLLPPEDVLAVAVAVVSLTVFWSVLAVATLALI